jgi:hypothetical protein
MNSAKAPTATSRRNFFKETAQKAIWAAPALAVIMTAGSTPAQAQHRYNKACRPKDGNFQSWFRMYRRP